MPEPYIASMPPYLALSDGYTLRINAIDPTTGAQVTGVQLSAVTIMIDNLSGGGVETLSAGAFRLVPGPGS